MTTIPLRRIAKWAGPLAALLVILLVDLDPEKPAITYTAAVALWMVIWWLTEAVPLAVSRPSCRWWLSPS